MGMILEPGWPCSGPLLRLAENAARRLLPGMWVVLGFFSNDAVVGGLLSAHLMSHRMGMVLEPGWPCSGPLLRLAENAARRLLPGTWVDFLYDFHMLLFGHHVKF